MEEMTFADLKIAVDPGYEPNVTVDGSKKYIEEALSILGEDYLSMIKRAYDERWIDFAQNKGKSTGAFCAALMKVNDDPRFKKQLGKIHRFVSLIVLKR
jgi:oligoendopeptidase F